MKSFMKGGLPGSTVTLLANVFRMGPLVAPVLPPNRIKLLPDFVRDIEHQMQPWHAQDNDNLSGIVSWQ